MLRNSVFALAAFALYAPGAAAQTFYGARKAPSVSVDMTVLDELGPAPNVPRALGHAIPRPSPSALQQAAPPLAAVHLHPPAESKRHKAQKSKAGPMAAETPAPKAAKAAKPTTPEPLVATAPPPTGSVVAPPPPPPPLSSAATPPPASSVAAPPPSAAPTPPVPPAQQLASRPATAVPADTVRILFDGENTELSEAGKQALNAVVQKMNADQEARLQLVAYATGPGDQASKARRVSLSRALSARGYLITQGVRSTRIDVRALGHTDEQQADRVDAVFVKR
ncbi:MAG: OmpA family protein [Alphaproteobacteria bacterium]